MLSFDILPVLDLAMSHVDTSMPGFALGNQVIAERDTSSLSDFSTKNNYHRLQEEGTVEALLYDRYALDQYEDCDLNGKAMHCFDFGEPLDEAFVGRYGFCFNDGSTMLILDQQTALNNMIELLAPGGVLLSQFTVNRHLGFYNYNPDRIIRAFSDAGLTLIGIAELALYYDGKDYLCSRFTLGETPLWEMERIHAYTADALVESNGKQIMPHIGVWVAFKKTSADISLGSHKLITR